MFETITVRQWMTSPAVTITSAWSIPSAFSLMKEMGIRHLPVVDNGKLVGIVTLSDILEAEPSDATTLSVWELSYLWNKLTVETVMTRNVFTISPDAPILDAVQMLLDHKFRGLPVVDKAGELVGFLSEIDVYRLILQVRETAKVP
jgi:CBS-domain-containing membrane protein